jgi:hypothetical protein
MTTGKKSPKKAKPAIPPVPSKIGYSVDGGRSNIQVKIATSNLFIDTGSVPIDYMTGAVFDGIGGNEFINGGSSEIILQEGNSLISNASDVLYSISSKANEKQSDGTDTYLSQFPILLKTYIPTINAVPAQGVGITAPITLGASTYITTSFTEKNVYFDSTYSVICIELTNLAEDEEVEVEFLTSATYDSGII